MKFFITGANGFIGSYLSRNLLQQGHEVITHSRKFYHDIRTELDGATFIECDILSDEFTKIKCEADVVVHLASSNDIVSKNITKGIELSTIGTVNALKLATNNRIPKFIFYSTLQVLGTELSGNYDLNSKLLPENDYSMNHIFGELYAEMLSRKSGLKVVVARPSNIYGNFVSKEIERWTLVPGCLLKEALEHGTITLLSSGKQYRNFISLKELSYHTTCIAANMKNNFEQAFLTSKNYYRIIEVAELCVKILNDKFDKKVELIVKSDKPAESNFFSIDRKHLSDFGIDINKDFSNQLSDDINAMINMML